MQRIALERHCGGCLVAPLRYEEVPLAYSTVRKNAMLMSSLRGHLRTNVQNGVEAALEVMGIHRSAVLTAPLIFIAP